MASGGFHFKNVSKERKTFRVGSEGRNVITYPHAIDMWYSKFGEDWGKIKQIVSSQCHGSQKDADRLGEILTIFKMIASQKDSQSLVGRHNFKGAQGINAAEKAMLAQLQQESPQFVKIITGLVPTWRGTTSTMTGNILEKFIEDMIQQALIEVSPFTSIPQVQVGGQQAISRVKLGTVDVFVPNGLSLYDNKGALSKEIRDGVIDLVAADVQNEVATRVIRKVKTNQYGYTYTIEARLGQPKQQKIDDIANFNLTFEPTGILGEFLSLVQGKTFSVKNYNFNAYVPSERLAGLRNGRFVHIGDTKLRARKYGSFYFAGTGSENGSDIATFMYSTIWGTHQGEKLSNYARWVDLLYEGLGIGQQADNRLVDYLIINNNDKVTDHVLVISFKDYVKNINPAKTPDLMLDVDGTITVARANSFLYIK